MNSTSTIGKSEKEKSSGHKQKSPSDSVFVHDRALVDSGAVLGEGTRVWAFAHVMSGARIGSHCNIGDYAFVESGATLGDQVTVKNGVQVWEGIVVENGVFLGPGCVFTNDKNPRSFIKRSKEEYLIPTLLREGATIGANATIVCGVTIGRYAFVAAGAVVSRDVADFELVIGVPAQHYGWMCKCATRLKSKRGSKIVCPQCGCKYQLKGSAKNRRLFLESETK